MRHSMPAEAMEAKLRVKPKRFLLHGPAEVRPGTELLSQAPYTLHDAVAKLSAASHKGCTFKMNVTIMPAFSRLANDASTNIGRQRANWTLQPQ